MFYQLHEKSLVLSVRVAPNARRSGIEGIWNGTHLKIALTAPPVDGKANEALINFLSEYFALRKSGIELISGQTGRLKTVRLTFTETEAVETAVQKLSGYV